MIRLIEYNDIDFSQTGNMNNNKNTQQEYLILDKMIWEKGREYFIKNTDAEPIPVVNDKQQVVCYAWFDKEARREVRMLWELAKCDDAIDFRDLYPEYTGVTIHGCNELAWYMAEYLISREIPVNVEGCFWQELGMENCNGITSSNSRYEIWAEGVHQRSGNWKHERLRSSSAEFECIDKIYEANIKVGKITDADGNDKELLEKLRREEQIVIRGTGTKAQDAYDWLFSNGIDICAFQSEKSNKARKRLFGRPILRKAEVEEQFKKAVVLECASKHSAWGFGDVNVYAYGGYERNVRYLLLRDYLEVPENNLKHLFVGKNLVLIGDINLCKRAYRWWEINGEGIGKIRYWDILGENEAKKKNVSFQYIKSEEFLEDNAYLVLMPEYSYKEYLTEETAEKKLLIFKKLMEYEVFDYTDYFSDMMKCIHLENEAAIYRKELCPKGILLGAIPPFSGNVLFRQIIDGHPQVMTMEQVDLAVGIFLCMDIYSICIRLTEEDSKNILTEFWALYQREVKPHIIEREFPDVEKFNKKMEELLSLSTRFTSQELFVMLHIANGAMFGREIENIDSVIIYWEPHGWDRKYVREWAYWLCSDDVKGFTISMVRNKYIHAGSSMRAMRNFNYLSTFVCIYGWCYVKNNNKYRNWQQCTIKFEELKCNPKKILTELCDWLGIIYHDILMETTFHGEKSFFDEKITGFDVKPAYNLYEEYFSVFDRMRISILAGSYQKQYGYPYINCTEFTRRELQEMFLKEFRWENIQGTVVEGKNEESIYTVLDRIRYLLWLERFAEIMKVELIEEY